MEQATSQKSASSSPQAGGNQPNGGGANPTATPPQPSIGTTWADKLAARESKNLPRK